MLKEGDAAPDFVLWDAQGRPVRLSSFQGRVVALYFYPRDQSAGCTLEACNFRDHHEDLQQRGVQVVGVSLDSVDSHASFREKHNLPFLLLSDTDGRVHDMYGAWHTTLLGRSPLAVRRCTFLIDRDGIIRKVYGHVIPLRHAQQVLKDAEALGLVRPVEAPPTPSPPAP